MKVVERLCQARSGTWLYQAILPEWEGRLTHMVQRAVETELIGILVPDELSRSVKPPWDEGHRYQRSDHKITKHRVRRDIH